VFHSKIHLLENGSKKSLSLKSGLLMLKRGLLMLEIGLQMLEAANHW
jgi:hypothetical protein